MFCTAAVYPPFTTVVTALFCSRCDWWKKNEFRPHVRLTDFSLHSIMSSLKISVCAIRVITIDTIITLDIVWPPDLANSLPS